MSIGISNDRAQEVSQLSKNREEKGQYDQEVAWQKSCARIAAQGQVIQGKISEIPTKEIEELEDSFYQAKDAYMELYRENRQVGKPLVLQNYMFGNGRMYEVLNRLSNLQRRVE